MYFRFPLVLWFTKNVYIRTDNKEDSYITRGTLSNIYDIFFISSAASSSYRFTAQKKKKNWIIIIHRHIWKWMAVMKWNGNHIIILTSSRLTFMEHLSKGRLNHYGTVGLMVKKKGIRICNMVGWFLCLYFLYVHWPNMVDISFFFIARLYD